MPLLVHVWEMPRVLSNKGSNPNGEQNQSGHRKFVTADFDQVNDVPGGFEDPFGAVLPESFWYVVLARGKGWFVERADRLVTANR